ncbi:potassium channel subfamily K member 13-like [Amphiura filiformis]|uniref:potassium channel subfamily K member 13-like n=1 Tax=Amphiura filiformis TaxID=82378 RepID=UPI003B222C27
MARESCCAVIHLKEDNARFVLLILFLVTYILVGATIFSAVEREKELEEREHYDQKLKHFKEMYITNRSELNESVLMQMLNDYSYAKTKGITENHRPRKNLPGTIYFVSTVVSTIGFGMTSPSTQLGRALLICYGLPGCAACILFFNLFLERLITFLAYVMKQCHERKIRKQKIQNGIPATAAVDGRRPSQQSDDNLDNWKPSVYWVLLYLIIAVTIITCCASAVYMNVEMDWDYFDAVYFCFVAFSTIGFGDYVSSQDADYDTNIFLYRFANFIFLVSGVCCIYSLYNVVSIVIKQFLNFFLKKLDCRCCHRRKPRPRRNAITPGQLRTATSGGKRNNNGAQPATVDVTDVDSNYDSETDGRRMSGEMISMKDFLAANKVSLAVMQKQLYETSNKSRGAPGPGGHGHSHHTSNGAFGGGIGGIAMLNNKLAETERRE